MARKSARFLVLSEIQAKKKVEAAWSTDMSDFFLNSPKEKVEDVQQRRRVGR